MEARKWESVRFGWSGAVACAVTALTACLGSRLELAADMVRLSRERELLKQQNRAYRAESDRLRQSERQIRALRHDLNNHLAVLETYAARGQTEKLERYLGRLGRQLARPGFVSTGNPEIDGILNDKLGQAERAGARLEVDVHLPENLAADVFDLAVILGNLLDNAVEGLEKSVDKRLSLSLTADRGMLFLNLVNSYDGAALRTERPDGPEYHSRKGGPEHGLGLSIVRSAVERYHGELRLDSAGTVFTAEVMLYLEP